MGSIFRTGFSIRQEVFYYQYLYKIVFHAQKAFSIKRGLPLLIPAKSILQTSVHDGSGAGEYLALLPDEIVMERERG